MELLNIQQMIMIGSTGRNSGKTTLAIELIKKYKNKFPIIALKITTIKEKDGKCQRGGQGCGACTNIKENFELLEENNKNRSKDTSLLLTAGAEKVYWLKCLKTHLYDAIKLFMEQVPEGTLVICESNSLRTVVVPGSFMMLKNIENNIIKESASEVIDMADIVIENSIEELVKKVEVEYNGLDFIIKNK